MLLARPLLVAAVVAAAALGGWAALRLSAHDSTPPSSRERERGPVAVVDVAAALGAMAASGGDLWIDDRASARLLRVDGGSGRVRAALPVTGRLAIGAGPGAVWALEAGGDDGIALHGPLLRVDPASGAVRARVPLGGVIGFGVLARGRDVWIWGPRDVLRVDARTARVAQRIRVGGAHGELRGLALVRRRLVVATADGTLLR